MGDKINIYSDYNQAKSIYDNPEESIYFKIETLNKSIYDNPEKSIYKKFMNSL